MEMQAGSRFPVISEQQTKKSDSPWHHLENTAAQCWKHFSELRQWREHGDSGSSCYSSTISRFMFPIFHKRRLFHLAPESSLTIADTKIKLQLIYSKMEPCQADSTLKFASCKNQQDTTFTQHNQLCMHFARVSQIIHRSLNSLTLLSE